jgi:hypothetical protein
VARVDAFLEVDARLLVRIEYLHAPLHQDGLQKHLGSVLHMKQHGGDAPIVIAGVKRGYCLPKRAQRFGLQGASLAPQFDLALTGGFLGHRGPVAHAAGLHGQCGEADSMMLAPRPLPGGPQVTRKARRMPSAASNRGTRAAAG